MADLNPKDFDTFLTDHRVVLIDFYAPWCGPCRAIAPAIEELIHEFEGRAGIAKVNIDEAGHLADRFSISAVPTFILFQNGQKVDQFSGARTKEELKKLLNSLIGR